MKRLSLLLAALSLSAISFGQNNLAKLTDYVNPLVGTDFHGHTFPGAAAPFGMVQLSPDTRLDTWDGCSGYHYSDSGIYGFSHTHLSGTGCSDYGDVLLMPVKDYTAGKLDNTAYKSPFSHDSEKAAPAYYEVFLQKPEVKVELTVGDRIGMHRYTYPKKVKPQIIIDLQHRDILLESSITQESKTAVSGMRRSKAWSEDQSVYFYIEFSKPIAVFTPFGKEGALLTFKEEKGGNVIQAKIGISSVSVANAMQNLHYEMCPSDWNFDALRNATECKWERYLSKIDVRGSKVGEEKFRTFYTALYHTAISPNIFSDVNGEYRGMDRQVHKASGFRRYTVFSLWDTFRALHPLFTIIERERTLAFMKTFQSIFDEGGKLPVWELAGYETNCMIGYNSVSAIADAVAKGIDGFSVEKMLDAMVASSTKKEYGLDVFRENGLVIADKEHESVSKTLEYAYDDWCVAQVAKYLLDKIEFTASKVRNSTPGAEEKIKKYRNIYEQYSHSALYYRNLVDPQTGFMRPRLDGRWLTPFRPEEVNNHFTEANSWQYSFFVPQDIEGHIALLGGDSLYCDKIDKLFRASDKTSGRTQVDITGLIGQYAHGNEPSHHIPYLYAYAGQSWKTQRQVRDIMSELYTPAPDGLCGNEDCGQMSAWYVLSAIGFYAVTPGSTTLVFGSPIFDHVVINLENGKKFTINAAAADGSPSAMSVTNWIDSRPFIKSVALDGQKYNRSWIDFNQIFSGSTLTFRLADEPNKAFGAAPENRPHSKITSSSLVINPWFEMENTIFHDSMEVRIAAANPADKIFFSVDSGEYLPYSSPLSIKKNTSISAYCVDDKGNRSFTSSTALYKTNNSLSVKLLNEYNPQYSAGGPEGLIDGKRGTENWRTGGWQGYQATDFTAIVDLREARKISKIGAGFCQDARSWIWMPVYAEYSVSSDGVNYTTVGRIENTVDPKDYNVQIQDLVLNLETAVSCRYVKVFAKNFGTIPDWHLGAGDEGFIFIDEIFVK